MARVAVGAYVEHTCRADRHTISFSKLIDTRASWRQTKLILCGVLSDVVVHCEAKGAQEGFTREELP